jgi:hypothetical protein
MKRNIIIILGGIVLSLLLIVLGGWVLATFTNMGKIASESAALGRAMEHREVVAKYGDPFKSLKTASKIIHFGIFPIGSLLIGGYVGFLAKNKEVIVSAITLFPFLIIVTSTDSSRVTAFMFAVFYLSICCFTTFFIARWRATKMEVTGTSNKEAADGLR